MNELGNDTASAVFRLGTKFMEELFKLLKFIFESSERKVNREIKKAQMEEAKQKSSQLRREEKIEKRREIVSKKKGLIKYKQLMQCGEPVYPVGYQCSQKEIDRLNRLAKMEGIPFAILKNSVVHDRINEIEKELKQLKKDGINDENKERYEKLNDELKELENRREEATVMVRESDLERFKNLTDRLNKEIRLKNIDEKIAEYEQKGEDNLSEEEKRDLQIIRKEKNEILRDEFDDFNQSNNDVIIAGNDEREFGEKSGFESALSRVTDRDYSTKDCYICDRTKPENYIQVSSKKEISGDGNPYVNTEYKVYNNGLQQKSQEFKHGKFTHYTDSQGKSTSQYGQAHWENMKKEIKEKGGFSDDVLIFASKERYEEYKREFSKIKEEAIPKETTIAMESETDSFKEYASIINKLKSQLSNHNMVVNDQGTLMREDGAEVKITSNAPGKETLETAEMINVAKQLMLYEKLNENQTRKAFAKNQIEVNEEIYKTQGNPENMKEFFEKKNKEFSDQIKECEKENKDLKEQIDKLQNERLQLRSVGVVEKVQDDTIKHEDTEHYETVNEREEFTHGEEKGSKRGQTKADYEKSISRSENRNISTEKEIGQSKETVERTK